MDSVVLQRFTDIWNRYFIGAELPLAWYYTNEPGHGETPRDGCHCLIGALRRARAGVPLSFAAEDVPCGGGKYYLGFSDGLRPGFEYFLSCGIPGVMEGERYKKTPALVSEYLLNHPPVPAQGTFIVFKRWDILDVGDEPSAVVFFAPPDVLSGLFTLINFDEDGPDGVIAPMTAGCGSIVNKPLAELATPSPRAVLGMFDVSARPSVQPGVLTLAVPMPRLVRMIDNADESFLCTPSWEKVRRRIMDPANVKASENA